MKIVAIIGIIVVAVIGLIIVFLAMNGLFAKIKIREEKLERYILVFGKHIGDYRGSAQVMDEIYYDLKDNHSIETTKGFGIYYDNPKNTETDKLRSICGCIVEGVSIDELNQMGIKHNIIKFPSSMAVTTTFPYKSKMSIFMGIMRVYPKLGKFIEDGNYEGSPIMEIYDQPGQIIRYSSFLDIPEDYFDELLKL